MKVISHFATTTRERLVQSIYVAGFLLLGLIGLASPYEYNAAPATPVFEVLFFTSALLVFSSFKKIPLLFFLAAAAYVLFKFLLMVEFNRSNIFDFLQAYKAFIYILPLSVFIGRGCFDYGRLANMVKILVWLFALKYGYSRLLDLDPRMAVRPGLYAENNFELITLIGLFYLVFHQLGKAGSRYFAGLFGVVLISGSRSALVAAIILYAAIYVTKFSKKTLLYLICFAGMIMAAGVVFADRMDGGVKSVDRYKFLLVFIYEIRDWSPLNYFFGTFPITPLAPESCGSLAFYSDLFSKSGDGTCYSVILHSYLLRVIFDQGLFGLVFLSWFTWYGMRKAKHDRRTTMCILGIVIASSISVSAFNSVYVAILLAFAFGGGPSLCRRSATVGQSGNRCALPA